MAQCRFSSAMQILPLSYLYKIVPLPFSWKIFSSISRMKFLDVKILVINFYHIEIEERRKQYWSLLQ